MKAKPIQETTGVTISFYGEDIQGLWQELAALHLPDLEKNRYLRDFRTIISSYTDVGCVDDRGTPTAAPVVESTDTQVCINTDCGHSLQWHGGRTGGAWCRWVNNATGYGCRCLKYKPAQDPDEDGNGNG